MDRYFYLDSKQVHAEWNNEKTITSNVGHGIAHKNPDFLMLMKKFMIYVKTFIAEFIAYVWLVYVVVSELDLNKNQ